MPKHMGYGEGPLHPDQSAIVVATTGAIKAVVCCLTAANAHESKQAGYETEFPDMPSGEVTVSNARAYFRAVMAKAIELIDKTEVTSGNQ